MEDWCLESPEFKSGMHKCIGILELDFIQKHYMYYSAEFWPVKHNGFHVEELEALPSGGGLMQEIVFLGFMSRTMPTDIFSKINKTKSQTANKNENQQ